MGFTTQSVTSVQALLAGLPIDKVRQLVGALDVVGGQIVNTAGVITIGGRGLTNSQYYQIYEMIEPMF